MLKKELDEKLMEELSEKFNYLDELTTPWTAEVIEAIFGTED
jgi:hypothetical protein